MMIPEDHELCRNDGRDFKVKMIDYIRRHFSNVLGDDARLLDEPDGLERLAESRRIMKMIPPTTTKKAA